MAPPSISLYNQVMEMEIWASIEMLYIHFSHQIV